MQYFILEQALNYFINNSTTQVSALNGKTLRLTLDNLPITLNFIIANDRVFVSDDNDINTDVCIKLKSGVFRELFQGTDLTDLLRQDKIIIHGDVKTAQLLVDLLQQIDIDLEELLSQYTGDVIAHQIGKRAKKLQQLSSPKDKLVAALITPVKSELFSKPCA